MSKKRLYKFLRYPEGKDRAVTLSFDDGYITDMRFSDKITPAGLKCTFNLASDGVVSKPMSVEQVKEYIIDRGHEVAVHGKEHRPAGALRPIEGIREVLDCRLELEEKYGFIIRGMAYPDCGITRFENGANYEQVKTFLTELDIAYARSLGSDNTLFNLPQDWHNWMPSAHMMNPDLMEMFDKFLNEDLSEKRHPAYRRPSLFYLWGHSREFEYNNNWELLDDICEKFGGHDNVWYATNMEIYEYVNAYNSLIYSADGETIYNPTLIDVWFDVDCKLYKIASGETIKL